MSTETPGPTPAVGSMTELPGAGFIENTVPPAPTVSAPGLYASTPQPLPPAFGPDGVVTDFHSNSQPISATAPVPSVTLMLGVLSAEAEFLREQLAALTDKLQPLVSGSIEESMLSLTDQSLIDPISPDSCQLVQELHVVATSIALRASEVKLLVEKISHVL
jgi:hypothetical protein